MITTIVVFFLYNIDCKICILIDLGCGQGPIFHWSSLAGPVWSLLCGLSAIPQKTQYSRNQVGTRENGSRKWCLQTWEQRSTGPSSAHAQWGALQSPALELSCACCVCWV